MKKLLLVSVLGASAILAGCSGTLPVSAYTPQNYTRFEGSTTLGEFSYAPYEQGKVKANQIQNTAVGVIYTFSNIADTVKQGTALELEKTGIKLVGSDLSLSGKVKEFKADDLGFSVDWTYAVEYTIKNIKTAVTLLSKDYKADPIKTGKFGLPMDYSNAVNNAILSAYNKFITDPQVREILETKK